MKRCQRTNELVDLSLVDYMALPDNLKEKRVCMNCGDEFIEMQNIGRLGCALHPGVVMTDGTDTGEPYYSCCGISVHYDTREHIEANLYRAGCLRVDHMCQRDMLPLCEDDQLARLTQLRQFAVCTIATLLMDYIARPKPEMINRRVGPTNADNRRYRPWTDVGSVVVELPVLSQVFDFYERENKTSKPYDHWRQKTDACTLPVVDRDQLSTVSLNIVETKKALQKMAQPNTFLHEKLRLTAAGVVQRGSLFDASNHSWRDSLSAKLPDPAHLDWTRDIAFTVIKRMDNNLLYNTSLARSCCQ